MMTIFSIIGIFAVFVFIIRIIAILLISYLNKYVEDKNNPIYYLKSLRGITFKNCEERWHIIPTVFCNFWKGEFVFTIAFLRFEYAIVYKYSHADDDD